MELWIRSQDKSILENNMKLSIKEMEADIDPRYNHFGIYGNEDLLGEYKTKERALEVLDEIQKVLTPKPIVTFSNKIKRQELLDKSIETIAQPMIEDIKIMERLSYVYEIPKE